MLGSQSATLNPPLPPKGLRIWTVGDSITEGDTEISGQYPSSYFGGWRIPLWRRQRSYGLGWSFVGSLTSYVPPNGGAPAGWSGVALPSDQANHDGHSGDTTADIIAGIASWNTGFAFNLGILSAGTNDINHSFGSDSGGKHGTISDATVLALPARLASIATTMHAYTGAPIMVCLPPPIAGKTAAVTFMNNLIRPVLQALSFVTVSECTATLSDICVDGLHPTPAGYQRFSDDRWNTLSRMFS